MVPRLGQHRLDGVAIQSAGPYFAAHLLRSLLGKKRRTMRSWLSHRPVRIGGGHDAGGGRQRLARAGAVVAGAIYAFVMLGCQGSDPAEWLGASQDPVRVVGMQPDLLPLAVRQRPLLSPNAGGNTDATEVMQQACAAQCDHVRLHQPAASAGA